MSARSNAEVVDLEAARNRPAGERTVARRSDGHRLGNHGNRSSRLMRMAVIRDLRDIALISGDVTADDKKQAAARADVSYRQVCRWWRADLARQLDETGYTPTDATDPTAVEVLSPDGNPVELPRYLYRYAEPGKFQFTKAEIAFIGQHRCTKDGFEALAQVPGNRIVNVSRSTLYAAWKNVTAPVRAGIRYDDKTQRANEATYPLTGREQVNESFSIDEYDLKILAGYRGVKVEPKVLILRERLSGMPIAYKLMPRAATGTDTGVLLAAGSIGFTCPHPRDPNRELRVSGVARFLVSDQGGPFFGDEGAAAARRLGIACNPIESHRPQSNGDHEVMHQSLLRHFIDGPGSRRGYADRSGARLDHGVLPWEAVEEEMAVWWTTLLNTAYTKGERKGRTRLEVYADEVDAGNYYQGHTLTPVDEAALAVVVAERHYDETRGINHDKRDWLSRELAAKAESGERITVKQLLDPNVIYAFDRHDRFISILTPRDENDVEQIHDLYADRAARQRFVEGPVAQARAEAARGDAAAAWAHVAEGLADASDHPDYPKPDETAEPAPTQPPTSTGQASRSTSEHATETDAVTATEDIATDRVHADVVHPTRRNRRPAPLAEADTTADEDADAIAAFYTRNNTTQHHTETQTHSPAANRPAHENTNGGEDDAH